VDIEVPLEHTPLDEVPMVYELCTSGMAADLTDIYGVIDYLSDRGRVLLRWPTLRCP
jgi:hypothetical protein